MIQVRDQQGTPDYTTVSVYNAADDLTRVTAPDGEITNITYDTAGRKLTVNDPDSAGLWRYGYDANSNLISETDPLGDVTMFQYDNLDRVTREYVDGAFRGLWAYDPAGNLGLERVTQQRLTNGEGIIQEFSYYDQWGRLTQVRDRIPDANGSGLLNFRSFYTYRDDGSIDTIEHPSSASWGHTYHVEYGYNPRTGAQTQLAETPASGGQTIVHDVEWNHAGQVTTHLYGSGANDPRATWNYNNGTQRLAWERFGDNAFIGEDRFNQYTYDNNGNIANIREVRNSGQYQCFVYDNTDRLTRAFTDNTNACDTPPNSIGAGAYNDTYSYDAGGNITARNGSGAGTHPGTYTYSNGNLAHAVTATSDGSTFNYDANGNMTLRNLAGQPAQTLTWDEGRRLEEITVGGQTEAEFLYAIDDRRVRRLTGDGTATY